MNMKNSNSNNDTIGFRQISGFFMKSKWWFIGTFLIILIGGLLFTFLKSPEYSSSFQVKIKDSYYDDYLYKYSRRIRKA